MQVVAVPGLPRIDQSSNLAQLICDATLSWPDGGTSLDDGDLSLIHI
jgi:hypothetical protein